MKHVGSSAIPHLHLSTEVPFPVLICIPLYLLFALSMEFVIGIVSSIFTKAAEYTISPIINHVKYLSNHQQNVET
ncbi:hypothetical protein Gotri_026779, partial [Gossypium trilobum]|nr:hypothetical protein [Gossypium trilobum]